MYCALYGGLINTMYYFAKTSRGQTDLGRRHFATGLVVIFPPLEQRVSASRNSVFKTRILVLAKYINTVAQKLENTVFSKKSNVYKKFERYRKIKVVDFQKYTNFYTAQDRNNDNVHGVICGSVYFTTW